MWRRRRRREVGPRRETRVFADCSWAAASSSRQGASRYAKPNLRSGTCPPAAVPRLYLAVSPASLQMKRLREEHRHLASRVRIAGAVVAAAAAAGDPLVRQLLDPVGEGRRALH